MLRALLRWLFGGYTCDGCGRWTPRRRGKANVTVERREVPIDLRGEKKMSIRVVMLRCPTCVRRLEIEEVSGERDVDGI